MDSQTWIPSLPKDEYLYISPEGFSRLGSIYDAQEPLKHTVWTTDYTVELPIVLKKEGLGNIYLISFHNLIRF